MIPNPTNEEMREMELQEIRRDQLNSAILINRRLKGDDDEPWPEYD